MKVCKNCKAELEDNQNFCHLCGSSEFEYKENSVSDKNENTSGLSEINEETQNSVEIIQTDIQNTTANEKNVENLNSAIIPAVKKTASSNNNNKTIIVVSAIVVIMIMIITIAVKNSSKSTNVSTTSTSSISSQTQKETTEETTQAKEMVSLVSMCPTYEEFMAKLPSSKITNIEVHEESGTATFNYSGLIVSVWYLENEPHNIKEIMVTDIISSSFSEAWYYSSFCTLGEIVTPYLDRVPNSESFETIFNDKLLNNKKTEQRDYATIVKAEYKLSGIKYSTEVSAGRYASYHIFSVSIDENYMIEVPNSSEAVTKKDNSTKASTTKKPTVKHDYLNDNANLLDNKEKDSINKRLDAVRNSCSFDIVILTTNTFDGKIVDDYADDYYVSNGYSDDGCILVLNMESREWYIAAYGKGKGVIDSESGEESISKQFLPKLKENKYKDSMISFINQVERLIDFQ